jgi:hypothetical protein
MTGVVARLRQGRDHGFPREEGRMIRNLRALPSPSPLSEMAGKSRREPLLELAAWYRAQAERAGSLWVWEARLQRAEDLEAQARRTSNLLARNTERPNRDASPRRKAS